MPQPSRSLGSAGAVASPAMWPGSVRGLGAPLSLFIVLLLIATIVSQPVSCSFCSCFCTVSPSAIPNIDESGHVMEELLHSSPKGPAISAPVSVHPQSVTVSAAPVTVTVSASPATVPVSVTVSAAPVTVTWSVSPAIVTAPAPATFTASSAIVTTSVPTTVTATVPVSQVSVTLSTASSSREFPKFSGDQDIAS